MLNPPWMHSRIQANEKALKDKEVAEELLDMEKLKVRRRSLEGVLGQCACFL